MTIGFRRRFLWGALVGLVTIVPLTAFIIRARTVVPQSPGARLLGRPGCEILEERHWRVPKVVKDGYFSRTDRLNEDIHLQPIVGSDDGCVSSLIITKLSSDGPMYAAGFRPGDRILKVNEKPVTNMVRALNLANEVQACARLTVQVERNGEVLDYRFDFE